MELGPPWGRFRFRAKIRALLRSANPNLLSGRRYKPRQVAALLGEGVKDHWLFSASRLSSNDVLQIALEERRRCHNDIEAGAAEPLRRVKVSKTNRTVDHPGGGK